MSPLRPLSPGCQQSTPAGTRDPRPGARLSLRAAGWKSRTRGRWGGECPHLRAQGLHAMPPTALSPSRAGSRPRMRTPRWRPCSTRLASSLPAALSAVASRINHAHAHLHLGVPSGGPQPITLSKHGDTSGRGAEPGRDGEEAASRAVPCVTSSAALPSPGRGQASHVTASARTREASSS